MDKLDKCKKEIEHLTKLYQEKERVYVDCEEKLAATKSELTVVKEEIVEASMVLRENFRLIERQTEMMKKMEEAIGEKMNDMERILAIKDNALRDARMQEFLDIQKMKDNNVVPDESIRSNKQTPERKPRKIGGKKKSRRKRKKTKKNKKK